MFRTGRFFTEEFRRAIISAISAGEISSSEAKLRYGIKGHSTILKWYKRYGQGQEGVMNAHRKGKISEKDEKSELQLLQNQNRLLEIELREARLKQAVFETLIDIAEREYSIEIKKNFGQKWLKK
jgi:transposase-like protein